MTPLRLAFAIVASFVLVVLAGVLAWRPSWPLAAALLVLALVSVAVLAAALWWDSRTLASAKVFADVEELRAAYVEHAAAISELKHRLQRQGMEDQHGLSPDAVAPWQQRG